MPLCISSVNTLIVRIGYRLCLADIRLKQIHTSILFILKCDICVILEVKQDSYLTEDISILLGQDNGRQVHSTGELDGAGMLAVQSLIEDCLSVLSFDDINRAMGHPATPTDPFKVSFVHSLV